ncbi:TetR/AcrR family transcriptional regulator [Sinisalibacter aestuarii]|uniref:Transcriptional regulator n=1 Tax=Sinisalibacter aestuarii TaxID=2949426 RepID=A0ABQ5LPN9_9RHOB|nr:TetR/AcrR family transcriptional regulator [Sinisalibacter aestuarii]GKY86972.1 transcriptional regulator [Sinisalibacter aestuarii]
MPDPKRRLSADDWLRAGLSALAKTGPEALKAEPLARALGATKGSFYWHFKDVPEYRARLATHWEKTAIAALSQAAEARATPAERLHGLAAISGDRAQEAAMRAWAQFDHTVTNAVAEVDLARLAYIGSVLHALGLTNPDFPRLLYSAFLGMQVLPGDAAANDSALSTLTAALLALQDA